MVLIHIDDSIYNLEYMSSFGLAEEFAVASIRTAGRIGVPIFLMLSGFLLLDREYDNQNIKYFLKGKWLHLLICTWIWIIIDNLVLFIFTQDFSIKNLIGELLFLKPVNLGHAWYMPMIIGMYLLIPFVARALRNTDTSTCIPVLLILVLLIYIFPLIDSISHITPIAAIIGGELTLQISPGFSGGAYGMYIIFGYLVKKDVFKHIKTFVLWIIFSVSFISTILFLVLMFRDGNSSDLWYDNFLVFITALCLFELMSRIRNVPVYPAARFISYYSFGVYLVHYLVIVVWIWLEYRYSLFMNPLLTHPVMFVIIVTVTLIIVFAISKIPKVGKYIFYLH